MNMSAASIDMSPTLAQLLQGFADAPDTPVNGIASDSRKVDRGYLFLACAGESGHGLDYISDVSSSGAAAIAWDSGSRASCPENADVLLIPVAGLAGHIGEIAIVSTITRAKRCKSLASRAQTARPPSPG